LSPEGGSTKSYYLAVIKAYSSPPSRFVRHLGEVRVELALNHILSDVARNAILSA